MDAKLFRWWLRQLGELSVRQVELLKERLAGSEARNDACDWINRGCKNFCVNGYLAGNCRAPRSEDDRSKESRTERVAGQPAG